MTLLIRSRAPSPYLLDWDAMNHWDTDGQPILADGAKGTHARNGIARCFDRAGVQRIVPAGMPALEHWLNPATGLWEAAGVLLEDTQQNMAKRSTDFSHADWVKTNVTVTANDKIAPDGTLTADLLTATSANGTVIQDLGAIGSAQNIGGAWAMRKTGVGNFQVTLDGGANWTTIALSSVLWTRVEKSQTVTNPDIGFRLVTSGDAVWVWNAMHFVNTNFDWTSPKLSSDIVTTSAAVTRALSTLSLPFGRLPGALTILVEWQNRGTAQLGANLGAPFAIGAASGGLLTVVTENGTTNFKATHYGAAGAGGAQTATLSAPAHGDWVTTRLAIDSDGAFTHGETYNGAAEVAAVGTATPLAATYGVATISLNLWSGGGPGFTVVKRVRVMAGSRSLAQIMNGAL